MPVDKAAVARAVTHGARDAQAQARAQGGDPGPGAPGTPAAGGSQGAPSSAAPSSAAPGAPGAAASAESSEGHGALAKVAAVFGAMTSAEQSLSTLLSGIPFPAFPAARITDTAVGIPHAHSHPPNLIVPPPIPFPVTGPIIKLPISGADKVLINNLPAARCGDIGVNIWCGGFFPFYEIFLGSSSVWIEGQRAARLGVDMTKHCIFSTPKPNDLPLGPPIGAIVTGSPNVIIGGVPLPSLTSMAVGAALKLAFWPVGKIVKAVRAAKAAAAEAEKAAQEAAENATREAAAQAAKEAAEREAAAAAAAALKKAQQEAAEREALAVLAALKKAQQEAAEREAAAAAAAVKKPSLAERILSADRAGSGLKADPSHRAASYLSKEQLEAGKAFTTKGGDGVTRELLQTPGEMNGKSGIFEYILDPNKGVTHQRFIPGGKITGVPNQKVTS